MRSVEVRIFLLLAVIGLITTWVGIVRAADPVMQSYETAVWHPAHFKPAINTTSDEQCLSCHPEILEPKVLEQSPAGVDASETLAWYQTLNTYEGPQETFHRRHLVTPLAKQLMNLKCNTCHEGNNPREEAPIPPTDSDAGYTLRKMVNPKTCLMCHGQSDYQIMGLPGPWLEVSETFGDSCMTCHIAFRTHRHQVNFLNAEAIEQSGKEDADVCYGCHGGRAWYRIAFPYPRHSWPGIAEQIPDWAKDRPTESESRFLVGMPGQSGQPAP